MSENEVNFVTSVIGALSLKVGKTCSVIYKKLNEAQLIRDYLVPAYDVLHTFSLDYVADDVIELMNKKGYSLC